MVRQTVSFELQILKRFKIFSTDELSYILSDFELNLMNLMKLVVTFLNYFYVQNEITRVTKTGTIYFPRVVSFVKLIGARLGKQPPEKINLPILFHPYLSPFEKWISLFIYKSSPLLCRNFMWITWLIIFLHCIALLKDSKLQFETRIKYQNLCMYSYGLGFAHFTFSYYFRENDIFY